MASGLRRDVKFLRTCRFILKKNNFCHISTHKSMPMRPPAFSESLVLDAAVIEHRNGAFESGRSRDGIEIFRVALCLGDRWMAVFLHVVVLLRPRRYPRMASRGNESEQGPCKGW
jgi:hypothetical protein